MFEWFQRGQIRYHNEDVIAEVTFRGESLRPAHPVTEKVLQDQQNLEGTLAREGLKSDARNKGKGKNTVSVAEALDNACFPRTLKYDEHTLQDIALNIHKDSATRPLFEAIYRANSECLSPQFNHTSTLQLNLLKQELLEAIEQFERDQLHNDKSKLQNKFNSTQLEVCKRVLEQTRSLIRCANSISGVIATLAIEADLLAQTGLADSVHKDKSFPFHSRKSSKIDYPANLFREQLPQIVSEHARKISNTPRLNTVGSAFQLGQAREALIARLETYLGHRARLVSETTGMYTVTRKYQAIDRGIFYNKELQQARINVAARLLIQIRHMQLDDGTPIDNPQLFANALNEAIGANIDCHNDLARAIDGPGELYKTLDAMRLEMGDIYPQNVRCGRGKDSANLHEQLDLPTPKPSILGHAH
ncbi:hypothetical protein [Legionella spiritensis]|uniref:hypothetical protein n=1 Tax=Legionella spiritensis TaxID=452 RepID=UPI000F701E2A|nr:hypothetical protein [Legionella spiritensis]VEG91999.1 Uncharacterised protein [Legionella spiritensis]